MENERSELPVLRFKIVHGSDGARVRYLADPLFEGTVVNEVVSEECVKSVEGGDGFLLLEVSSGLACDSAFDHLGEICWIQKFVTFEGNRFDVSLRDNLKTKWDLLSVGCAVGSGSGGVERGVTTRDGLPGLPN